MSVRTIVMILLFSFSLWALEYTCAMHPQIISTTQGSCPICGMDLVALEQPQHEQTHEHMDAHERSVVTIAPETIQNMGVVTEALQRSYFGRQIRAYGSVAVNAHNVAAVSVRADGWITSLEVKAVGERVQQDTLLFRYYAPELIHAQRDYLDALKSQHRGRIDLAKNRLISLGVSQQSLESITKTKRIEEHVPFYAPFEGIISKIEPKEGSYLKSGSSVLEITDYTTVWVIANVSEQEAVYIDTTTEATIVQRGLGGITYHSRVDTIYPEMNPATRMVPVRMVLSNPRGILRPGNVVEVLFESDFDVRLSVPYDAVLQNSEGRYVIVALGDGRFVPKAVQTGFISDGRVAITAGLSEGERIVVSGQYLLDSESSIRDALMNMRSEVAHDHAHH